MRRCSRGVMVKATDCGIVVSEFELQLRYYVHFQTCPWEKYEPPNPPSYGLNSTTTVLLEGESWHWITQGGWYAIKQNKHTNKRGVTTCFKIKLPTNYSLKNYIHIYKRFGIKLLRSVDMPLKTNQPNN